MMINRKGITTSVGYSFAFAALCSLAVSPNLALAEDLEGSSEPTSSDEPIVSDQATNAPVPTEKTETVYVFANPDGSVKNTEVSTTLKNPGGAVDLADSSILTDIENTESDNTYTGSGSNMVWDAAGKNVYYTGNTTKEAPVSVKVSYFLDGKKVSPDSLAGASGHVKIRYDYDNSATVKASVRGKEETLFVPFTFITAMLLDNESFKNAEVTNGKLIDDGDRSIVAGYAMPGLKKSLGSIVDDFDIPEYFEVEADVTDFEMKSSLTIVTSGLLSDLNSDDLDTSKLEDASGELTDAMDQIIDGSSSLESGLKKLYAGAKSASVATGQIADGASTLAKGNKDLSEGLGKMQESTSELPDGLKKLSSGARQLANGLPDAVSGLEKLETGAGTLSGYLAQLKSGLEEASSGADQIANGLYALENGDGETSAGLMGAKAGADELAEGLRAAKTSLEELSAAKAAVDGAKQIVDGSSAALSGYASKAEVDLNTLISDGKLTVEEAADLKADIAAINAASAIASPEGQTASDLLAAVSAGLDGVSADALDEAIAGAEQLSSGMETAIAVVEKLHAGAGELKKGVDQAVAALGDDETENTIINGAVALEAGVSQLKGDKDSGLTAASTGADTLAGGLEELNKKIPAMMAAINKITKGADKLADGSSTLAEGAGKLDDGIAELAKGTGSAASGAGKLTDGLQTFSDEGIGEITDLIDDDLLPFTDRLDALSKAGSEYDNFAGITKGTKGSVKFIFETDPIAKD